MSNERIFLYHDADVTVLNSDTDLATITSPLTDVSSLGEDVGLLVEDNPVTITPSMSTSEIKDERGIAQRMSVTEAGWEVVFNVLEDSPKARELFFGGTETATGGVRKIVMDAASAPYVKLAINIVCEDVDKAGTMTVQRYLVDGQLINRGAITYSFTGAQTREITIKALAKPILLEVDVPVTSA